jgi:hypothetical protein
METTPVPTAVTVEPAKTIPPAWFQLATDFFTDNKTANSARGRADKARKALYAAMKAAGVKSFSFPNNIDQKDVTLDVAIEIPQGSFIHVPTLLELVGQEKFLEIVTASQKAVDDAVGKNISVQCLRTGPGTENVKVTLAGE